MGTTLRSFWRRSSSNHPPSILPFWTFILRSTCERFLKNSWCQTSKSSFLHTLRSCITGIISTKLSKGIQRLPRERKVNRIIAHFSCCFLWILSHILSKCTSEIKGKSKSLKNLYRVRWIILTRFMRSGCIKIQKNALQYLHANSIWFTPNILKIAKRKMTKSTTIKW